MNNASIGIIDSGVGGLSIWREIVKLLPNESTIYLADQKNVPYGPRSQEEIAILAQNLIRFLLQQQVKLIVVACNTISVTCLTELREMFPPLPIIGTVPVVKKLAEVTIAKDVGIIATKRTIESEYLQQLIARYAQGITVHKLIGAGLVEHIEQGDASSPVLREKLLQILEKVRGSKIDAIALGSTHFAFLEKIMQEVLGEKVKVYDSGGAVARQTKRVLEQNQAFTTSSPAHSFYTTGDKMAFQKTAELLLAKKLANVYHASI